MHPGRDVLVSGHGHLNRVLLIHAMGWPRERFWRIPQPNAGCLRVDLGAREAHPLPLQADAPV